MNSVEMFQEQNTSVLPEYNNSDFTFLVNYFNKNFSQRSEKYEEVEDGVTSFRKHLVTLTAVLSLVTCVVATVFWIKITKWRTFQTFVYLNLLYCSTLHTLIMVMVFWGPMNILFDVIWIFARLFFYNLFICWLFIASVVSYMLIVTVFSVHVTRKRIKSFLFVIGVSFMGALYTTYSNIVVDGSISTILKICAMFLVPSLLICNFYIYVRVLYSLFNVTRLVDRTRFVQQLQVATFTFLMSGLIMLPALYSNVSTWLNIEGLSDDTTLVMLLIADIQKLIINVGFLLLKSNRKNWRELFCKRTDSFV